MNTVSIVVPTYNCSEYLPTAIRSALNQTFKNCEIIVIDDGSTDSTRDIMSREFGGLDRIRYFYQDNKGLPGARNAGIRKAKGTYIMFLDADDIYLPTIVERCHSFLEANPSHDVVITQWIMQTLDGGNHVVKETVPCLEDHPHTQSELRRMVFTKMRFNAYMMVRKEYIETVGLFDEAIRFCEDVDLWRRFAQRGVAFGVILEPLFIYRKRVGSLTVSSYGVDKLHSLLRLFHKYRSDILQDKGLRAYHAEHFWHLARESFEQQLPLALTLKLMILSQRLQPSLFRFLGSCKSVLTRQS